jgi:hypothetical protein
MSLFKYPVLIAVGLFLAVTPPIVRGDNITTFTATGTFAGGASLTGTIAIDTTVGTITSLNLSATGTPTAGPFTSIASQGPTRSTPPYYGFLSNSVGGFGAIFNFTAPNLVGYDGGQLCTLIEDNCPTDVASQPTVSVVFNGSGVVYFLTSGLLSPQAQGVPEPSSFILIGSGLTAWFAAKRRRQYAST